MTQIYSDRRDKLIKSTDPTGGMDALMITDPLSLLYFTGIKISPYERFIALLLDTLLDRIQLVLPSLERDTAENSGIAARFYDDQEDPFTLLTEFFGPCRKLGVEKNTLSLAVADKISTGFSLNCKSAPPELADISRFITDLRIIKDTVELENLSMAAKLSDEILSEVSAQLHIGQTEKEVTSNLMAAMATKPKVLLGEFVIQVLAGPNSADPHGYAGERPLQSGDPVTIDFGVCYNYYWSDCTRTFFMGPPQKELTQIYPIVLAAQQASIAKIEPGVPMADIDLAAREVIADAGYGDYFIHRVGHGIGLNIHEAPSLHNQNRTSLVEGMVTTIEPGIYLPGLGGVRIEEDVVVTAQGAKVLTHYPKNLTDMVLKL